MYYCFYMGDTFAGSANGISRATGFDSIALIFFSSVNDKNIMNIKFVIMPLYHP